MLRDFFNHKKASWFFLQVYYSFKIQRASLDLYSFIFCLRLKNILYDVLKVIAK